jgi:valyl-tRNA synthetase
MGSFYRAPPNPPPPGTVRPGTIDGSTTAFEDGMTLAAYDPKAIQERSAQRWAEAGGYRAEAPRPGQAAYSIVMPPPNVTGVLHLGHALNNTLQDVLIRWRRMKGDSALWFGWVNSHSLVITPASPPRRWSKNA